MAKSDLPPTDNTSAWVELIPGPPMAGSIRPPGSKSLTNRALLCAAFARSSSVLTGALRSEDTEVMIKALSAIGVEVNESDAGRRLEVDGSQRRRAEAGDDCVELYIANSGTTIRFLTAALSAAGGHYRLHGVARMHERPIRDLVDAIAPVLRGTIECLSPAGCPPVHIASEGWRDESLQVAGSVSSQFLSGLMLAAAIHPSPDRKVATQIAVRGPLVSRPYVAMTAEVMRSFGAEVEEVNEGLSEGQSTRFDIGAAGYQGVDYAIEPDASAASYFWAAAAITGGSVEVLGLSADAMQGDVGFCKVLQAMGCDVIYQSDSITVTGKPLRGVDVDMNAISDTVQTLAVVALFAEGSTRIRGVAHNRFKETDRIGDLARELRKLGATIDEHDDGLRIAAESTNLNGGVLDTYHDHRMAMSLALAGLRIPGVRIRNPACTAKTYPEFFADLERLLGRAHHWG